MRLGERGGRGARWLGAGFALALWPQPLANGPAELPIARRAPETLLPDVGAGPPGLALEAPDALLASVLRVEVGGRFPDAIAPAVASETPPEAAFAEPQRVPLAGSVALAPEPRPLWLALLSLASGACASRGRRRCLRPHPRP